MFLQHLLSGVPWLGLCLRIDVATNCLFTRIRSTSIAHVVVDSMNRNLANQFGIFVLQSNVVQILSAADGPAQRAASHPSCCPQRWTVNVINWPRLSVECRPLAATQAYCHLSTKFDRRRSPALASTPPAMPGTHPPIFWLGDVNGNISPQYYYALSDIADQYWLPSVRSASSRFHSLQSGRRTVGSQGSSPQP